MHAIFRIAALLAAIVPTLIGCAPTACNTSDGRPGVTDWLTGGCLPYRH
jgi:hypothetical protein